MSYYGIVQDRYGITQGHYGSLWNRVMDHSGSLWVVYGPLGFVANRH